MSLIKKLIIAAIILGVFILLAMLFMGWFTKHGQSTQVPDFSEMTFENAEDLADEKDLELLVIDSVYKEDMKPMTIVMQDPAIGAKVKPGRRVYLTINTGLIPQVKMPKLVNGSANLAKVLLANVGLRLGKVDSIKSVFGSGLVVKQLYKNKEIAHNTPLKKGSIIDLVVSKKVSNADSTAIRAMNKEGYYDRQLDTSYSDF